MMKRLMVLLCVCLFVPSVAATAAGQTVMPRMLGSDPVVTLDPKKDESDTVKKLTAAFGRILPDLLKALTVAKPLPPSLRDACNWLAQQPPSRISEELYDLAPLLGQINGNGADVKAYLEQEKVALGDLPTQDTRAQAEWLLGVCASLLVKDLAPPENPSAVAKKDQEKAKNANVEMHRRLVTTQLSLSRLRKWQTKLRGSRGQMAVRAEEAVSNAEGALRDSLDEHGLNRAFSATVFSGIAMGSNGVRVGTPRPESQIPETDSTVPITMLNVESKHWGWEGERTLDFAVRTSIGFRPVTNLVTVTVPSASKEADEGANPTDASDAEEAPAEADSAADPIVIQQNALAFAVGARVGFYTLKNIELSATGSLNVSRLTADKVILDPDRKDAFVTTPIEPSNRTRWGGETGVEVKFYDSAIRVLHAEGGMNSPAMVFAAGIRWDARLRARGSLEDVDLGRHPGRRVFLSVFLDTFKLFNPREVGESPKALDIGFGIEHDRPWFGSGGRIPSTTRFVIRGNLNLLSGKDEKK